MNWQAIIATLMVIAAVLWTTRRVWRIVKAGTGKGDGGMIGCGTCHKPSTTAASKPLVQLGKNSED